MSIIINGQKIAGSPLLYNATGSNTNGAMTQQATTNALDTKADTTFSNLTASAKVVIAHYASPSSVYKDIALGATRQSYEAPADGFFAIAKYATSGQYVYMGAGLAIELWSSGSGYIQGFLPVRKGEIIRVSYTASGTLAYFRFFYAQGSTSEA